MIVLVSGDDGANAGTHEHDRAMEPSTDFIAYDNQDQDIASHFNSVTAALQQQGRIHSALQPISKRMQREPLHLEHTAQALRCNHHD